MNLFTKLIYTRELSYISKNGEKVTYSTNISSKGEKTEKISIGDVYSLEKTNDNKSIYYEIDEKYEEEINQAHIFSHMADSGQRYIASMPNGRYTYFVRLCAYDSEHNIYLYSCSSEYFQPSRQTSLLINQQENCQINQDLITTILNSSTDTTMSSYSILDKKGYIGLPHQILKQSSEIANVGDWILETSSKLKTILMTHQYNIQDYVINYNKKANSR